VDAPLTAPADRRLQRALALLGALAFLVHALLKLRDGLLPELLWGCNVSAAALILAFAFDWPRVVGAAFLWWLVLGEPGFLAGLGSGGRYAWTTAFVHLVPTALAAFYLRRSGLPRGSALWAAAATLLLVPLSHAFTPPDLNVNLAHQRLAPLSDWLPGRWSYRFASAALIGAGLWLAEALARRCFPRPSGAAG
jgi:hypothetical protein